MQQHNGWYSHANFLVIACRGKHARVRGIPCHGVDAATDMALERLDDGAALAVEDVDLAVWRMPMSASFSASLA